MKKVTLFFKPTTSLKCIIGISLQLLLLSCSVNKPMTTSLWKDDLAHAMPTQNEYFIMFPNTDVIEETYNNSKAMRIIIKITDDKMQQKVLLNGLTVWIDTTGKRKEVFAIVFPSASEAMKSSFTGFPPLDGNHKGFDIFIGSKIADQKFVYDQFVFIGRNERSDLPLERCLCRTPPTARKPSGDRWPISCGPSSPSSAH